MVQGNLMVVTLGHWLVASETGVIAGSIAAAAVLTMRASRRWVVAVLLGSVTVVVDFFVHPGQWGPVALEAVVTGLGAAALSYVVGLLIRHVRTRRLSPAA
jgi:hypothetical protein